MVAGDVPDQGLRIVVARISVRPQLKRTAGSFQISGDHNLVERGDGKLFAFARALSQFVSFADVLPRLA